MNDFLTVEDINSIDVNNRINEYYVLDTGNIGTDEFVDVQYDFVKVSHEIVENDMHKFLFKIDNGLWKGKYCLTYEDNYVFNETKGEIQGGVYCITSHSTVKLYIILNEFDDYFDVVFQIGMINDDFIRQISLNEIGKMFIFKGILITSEGINTMNIAGYGTKGVYVSPISGISFLFLIKKTDLVFDLNNVDLAVGSVNHVPLGVDAHYLPSGDLVDGDELDAVVLYDGEELPVVFDSIVNDYCFDLDLTDKSDVKPVNLSLKVYESEYINHMESNFSLACHYEHASSFNELTRLLDRNVEIIELTEDLIVNNNILLGYDCLIKGNGSELDLNNHSIFIADGVNVKLQNINFINGKPAITQKDDSKLEITDCSFIDCSITDDYKGSVLSTYESENVITNITSTSIYNCPHSIWHDGELTLSKLTATYDKIDNIDTDYSMFLTKYDGIVEINNSVFDIELDTTTLCSEQINIKYAQSLFSISETVQINGLSGEKLRQNNSLNIFDNNVSNINATYYYPKIEACVRIKSDIRDKACCHHIIGTDWIFKNNTLLERL